MALGLFHLIGYYIAIGDEGLADKELVKKLRKGDKATELQYNYENEIEQFKNVGKLKAAVDKEDEYHIYWVNCQSMTGDPSYVFKTSRTAAEIALKMDPNTAEGQNMHSQVRGYKSLSLWTYHPGMQ